MKKKQMKRVECIAMGDCFLERDIEWVKLGGARLWSTWEAQNRRRCLLFDELRLGGSAIVIP